MKKIQMRRLLLFLIKIKTIKIKQLQLQKLMMELGLLLAKEQ